MKAFFASLMVFFNSISAPRAKPAPVKPMLAPFAMPSLGHIQRYEGLRLEAYYDGGGVATIGYGHTKDVVMGTTITQARADRFFREDIAWVKRAVDSTVKVKLNSNQVGALYSFVYNIGGSQWRTSTLLRKLNAGDYEGAANEFKRWNKDNGKTVRGLTNRRRHEAKLFRKAV